MRAGKQTVELPAGREVQPLRRWLVGRSVCRSERPVYLSSLAGRPRPLPVGFINVKKREEKNSLLPPTPHPATFNRSQVQPLQLQQLLQRQCELHIILRSKAKKEKREKPPCVFLLCAGVTGCVCVCASRVAYRALIPACTLLPKGSAGVQPAFIIHTCVIRACRATGKRHKGSLCFRTQCPQNYIIFFSGRWWEVVFFSG